MSARAGTAVDIGAGIVAALLIAAAALFGDPYTQRVLTIAGVYAINVIGYQLVFGHLGALSLAQGAFFGLGAYTTSLLALNAGLPFPLTLAASVAVPTLLAAVIALPVLRLESHYFALATLGIAQVILVVAVNWTAVTGGANGLPNVPGIAFGEVPLGRGWPTMLAVWTGVVVVAVAALAWLRPRRRLALGLARQQPMAAAAVGIDIARLRFAAFLMSAACGGVAGALYVHTTRVISPDALGFSVMVTTLAMTVIGGRLRIAGALIGALLLAHVPEWLRFLGQYYLIAYGVALLAFVVLAPDGIAGWLARLVPVGKPSHVGEPPSAPHPVPAAASLAGPVLAAAQVCKHYGGVWAVDGVDLEVGAGEVHGIIGANGSGKTTLLNCLGGTVRADGGTIQFCGEDITAWSADRRARDGIARAFQTSMLLEGETVRDNVAAGWLGEGGLDGARAEADAVLARCGLAGAGDSAAGELPMALRRRVEIARALVGRPRLVLLDEPAAGLTEGEQEILADMIAGAATNGVAWIVVDHHLPFLRRVAGRLHCMAEGHVIASGAPDAVLDDPAVRRGYFGEASP